MNRRNIRLIIAFDGTNYKGWQRQNNAPTIQGTIEECLSVITQSEVTLHGSGRTDSGVHALGMTAHYQTSSSVTCSGFRKGLNSMLPADIRILQAEEVPLEFHSRFDSTGKLYRYNIYTGRIQLPTERLYAAYFPGKLNIEKINISLQQLIGTHDFTSFEGSGSRDTSLTEGRGAIRTLYNASLSTQGHNKDTWSFNFTGDGFLRHMIRNLVGTLIEVGKEKTTPGEFSKILNGCDRKLAGPTAPAHGLFLEKVFYEPLQDY